MFEKLTWQMHITGSNLALIPRSRAVYIGILTADGR
jgi:hypothetical protein